MRIANGIKQVLTVGFIQEYLQLYQYNMQGILIKIINPSSTGNVTFTFKINGVIVLSNTDLVIPINQNQIDFSHSIILYKNDILTFECISVSGSGIGNPIFFGIY